MGTRSGIRKKTTKSAAQTVREGMKLAGELQPGDIVLLSGDLGAGKTHFTKGILKGLGAAEYAVSPTFTIVNEHRTGRVPLIHMDVYRLGDIDELYERGFDEYFTGEAVVVIEWADKFPELAELPGRVFSVNIRRRDDIDPDRREIRTKRPDGREDNKC
ncbi:MAG: tRNA (adenosine(37)-N6)-threonylcarbamoyltransferase complex ATPase subunit type 1 TsaE [Clostridia bacterium]|nr:tRNA (adenosine(37)-N6)-threonylcarbamoyltransferase complex ATPase subunit type 1 TsaE [Clostridia bacterium]